MKQFKTILGFELKGYLKNKIFVGVTLLLVVAIGVGMFLPNIMSLFSSDEGKSEKPLMLVSTENKDILTYADRYLSLAFPSYNVQAYEDGGQLSELVKKGDASCAFYLDKDLSCTYYVRDRSLYDTNADRARDALLNACRINAMVSEGLTLEEVQNVMSVKIESEVVVLGSDQMTNFFYTYAMIFSLYLVIMLYGQMVATNVATEKSSRAMELLITSTKPVALMFGKVIASCLAGLLQLVAVFGSALLFYTINGSAWGDNPIVSSLFNMPLPLLLYMLLFFVLGFLIYAFLYGAFGSTATKLEDINTSCLPLSFLFIVGFFVVVNSMSSGDINNPAMVACSYIPFTSPMAMFTRIAMSTVAWYEIVISVSVLIGSVVGIGYVAARIYRVGVLMYGAPAKPLTLLKKVFFEKI